jgi:hypothetical protein
MYIAICSSPTARAFFHYSEGHSKMSDFLLSCPVKAPAGVQTSNNRIAEARKIYCQSPDFYSLIKRILPQKGTCSKSLGVFLATAPASKGLANYSMMTRNEAFVLVSQLG